MLDEQTKMEIEELEKEINELKKILGLDKEHLPGELEVDLTKHVLRSLSNMSVKISRLASKAFAGAFRGTKHIFEELKEKDGNKGA